MRVTIASLTRPLAAFTLHDGYDRASWRAPMVQALTGLEGWLEGVTPRFEDPIVPTGHGSYGPADIYLASRIVTVRFAARAMFRHGGSSLMVAQFDDLVASLVGEWVEIRVEDASGVRTASGYVGALPVRERISEWAARYTLIMNCPDPLKYGTTVAYAAAGGAVDVRNEGVPGVPYVGRCAVVLGCPGRCPDRVVGYGDGSRARRVRHGAAEHSGRRGRVADLGAADRRAAG